MAVYEHLFAAYDGESPSAASRFLVIPRYALRESFNSKLTLTIFCVCFVYPLVAAILVYLHHNANALSMLRINVKELLPIDATFFHTFIQVQGAFALLLTVLVAPPLVSRDLSNNALPLYLCRPLSKTEYVTGKLAVIAFLLSLTTWIPGLLLFIFQASLGGFEWLWANVWMIQAIFFGSWVWIIFLAFLSLAVSAIVKWRVVASGALLGLFFVPSAFAAIVNNLFQTQSGNLLSLWASVNNVWSGLFGLFVREAEILPGDPSYYGDTSNLPILEPPLWASWLVLAIVCAVCVWLLTRKVRAYEVIG